MASCVLFRMRSRGNIARDLKCWDLVTSGTPASRKVLNHRGHGALTDSSAELCAPTSEKAFRLTVCFIALLYHGRSQVCVGESIALPH